MDPGTRVEHVGSMKRKHNNILKYAIKQKIQTQTVFFYVIFSNSSCAGLNVCN